MTLSGNQRFLLEKQGPEGSGGCIGSGKGDPARLAAVVMAGRHADLRQLHRAIADARGAARYPDVEVGLRLPSSPIHSPWPQSDVSERDSA